MYLKFEKLNKACIGLIIVELNLHLKKLFSQDNIAQKIVQIVT